jgi:hypothetical protein
MIKGIETHKLVESPEFLFTITIFAHVLAYYESEKVINNYL